MPYELYKITKDSFAGLAMFSILNNITSLKEFTSNEQIAKESYEMAEQMMEERERRLEIQFKKDREDQKGKEDPAKTAGPQRGYGL